jgi:hypothetical protein
VTGETVQIILQIAPPGKVFVNDYFLRIILIFTSPSTHRF